MSLLYNQSFGLEVHSNSDIAITDPVKTCGDYYLAYAAGGDFAYFQLEQISGIPKTNVSIGESVYIVAVDKNDNVLGYVTNNIAVDGCGVLLAIGESMDEYKITGLSSGNIIIGETVFSFSSNSGKKISGKCNSNSPIINEIKALCGGVPLTMSDSTATDDVVTFKSIQKCTTDRNCDESRYCYQNMCLYCNNDNDCESSKCDSGRCVECVNNSDCPSTESPENSYTCTVDGMCINCFVDAECYDGMGTCVDNTCWACTNPGEDGDLECSNIYSGNQPICIDGGKCVQCIGDSDCPNGACNTETGMCQGCSTDIDCKNNTGNPVCNPANGVCVECTGDVNCKDQCNKDTNRCVGCLSGNNGYCRETYGDEFSCVNNQCIECDHNNPCAEGFVCGKEGDKKGICVECENPGDCKTKLCSNNICVQCTESTATERCNVGETCSDRGICIQCIDDIDCDIKYPFGGGYCTYSGVCVECETSYQCDPNNITGDVCYFGRCVECIPGEDECDGDLICSADGKCVECSEDVMGNCESLGFDHCDDHGRCVECINSIDCPYDDLVCNKSGRCVECSENNQDNCTGLTSLCNVNGFCVECLGDENCLPYGTCGSNGYCVECDPDDENPGCAENEVCNVNGQCVGCVATEDCAFMNDPDTRTYFICEDSKCTSTFNGSNVECASSLPDEGCNTTNQYCDLETYTCKYNDGFKSIYWKLTWGLGTVMVVFFIGLLVTWILGLWKWRNTNEEPEPLDLPEEPEPLDLPEGDDQGVYLPAENVYNMNVNL